MTENQIIAAVQALRASIQHKHTELYYLEMAGFKQDKKALDKMHALFSQLFGHKERELRMWVISMLIGRNIDTTVMDTEVKAIASLPGMPEARPTANGLTRGELSALIEMLDNGTDYTVDVTGEQVVEALKASPHRWAQRLESLGHTTPPDTAEEEEPFLPETEPQWEMESLFPGDN